jgi:uncharacterized protein (TIGR01777 family)
LKKVLITGGSGFIGRSLGKRLSEKGYEVAILSRSGKKGDEAAIYHWDPEKDQMDEEALQGSRFIVNLAGANIGGKRWTPKRKQEIADSRVRSGELIFDRIRKLDRKPLAFITASATGYYGARTTEEVYTETSPPFDDFLGQTCSLWEQTADLFSDIGIRTVKIRTGIVLSGQGGILSRIEPFFRMGLGAAPGDGNQYIPWIHLEDLCNIYLHAIENERVTGACNAVAPEHTTFREFARKLAGSMNAKIRIPNIPAPLVKLVLGRMSDMILYGSRVSSGRIEAAGYSFVFPDLDSALKEIYS